jgi:hypothetical protein
VAVPASGIATATKRSRKSAIGADELAAAGDDNGAAIWRRITDTVERLANKVPPGPLH